MNKFTKFSRAIIAIVIMLVVGLPSHAYDFKVGKICYNITDETAKTVEVTYDGDKSYYGSVVIPEYVSYNGNNYSVTSIGGSAFSSCSSLTSIDIPNSVTSIGSNAFDDCSGLTSVNIPNSVTSIGTYAFFSCSSLTSVSIPNSVTYIGDRAFMYCKGLTSVTIGNSVTEIGDYAFLDCYGLTEIKVESGNSMYDSRDNCNAIIETSTNTLITGCKNTTIPNSVTEIRDRAFMDCSGLTSVTIPNSVTEIGDYAFAGCSGLTSVTIPNSVTEIGDCAFYHCPELTEIKVESGNSMYDSRDNCNAIIETSTNILITGCKNTTIPNSVTEIGDYAFFSCYGLISVTIPNSVTYIGDRAFMYCNGLTSVTIGNSVIFIDDYAFSGCTGLTEVIFNAENCLTMGRYDYLVFNGCKKLTKLTIGDNVKTIPDYAFCRCSGLTSITIPNSVTSIGGCAFYGCGLTSITIPNSVTSIKFQAFSNCYNLTEVIFNPESCTEMGGSYSRVFEYCTRVTKLTIGDKVKTIPANAFEGCSGLSEIISLNPTPPTCSGSFVFDTGIYSTAKLGVPEGSVSAYKSANVWKEFYNIEAGINDVVADKAFAIEVARYDANGRLLSKPTKGINIIKMSNGTTRKEIVK